MDMDYQQKAFQAADREMHFNLHWKRTRMVRSAP